MGSIISMALSAVIGCGLCVAAAAGITQVATTHIPVQVQQPLVDYGTRTAPAKPNPAADSQKPGTNPATSPTTPTPGDSTAPGKTTAPKKTAAPQKTTGPVKGKPTPNTPNKAPGAKK